MGRRCVLILSFFPSYLGSAGRGAEERYFVNGTKKKKKAVSYLTNHFLLRITASMCAVIISSESQVNKFIKNIYSKRHTVLQESALINNISRFTGGFFFPYALDFLILFADCRMNEQRPVALFFKIIGGEILLGSYKPESPCLRTFVE